MSEVVFKIRMEGAEEAKRQSDQIVASVGKIADQTTTANLALANLASAAIQKGLGMVAAGLGNVAGFAKDCVKEAADAEEAMNALTSAMKINGSYTESAAQGLQDYATELANTTTYTDDAIIKAMALGSSLGGLSGRYLRDATQAASDMAAALGMDLDSAMRMIIKATNGQTAALTRYGIVVEEGKNSSETFANVINKLNDQFGGTAKTKLNTYAGAVTQAEKAWADLKESMGKAVTENDAVITAFKTITEWIKTSTEYAAVFAKWLSDLPGPVYILTAAIGVATAGFILYAGAVGAAAAAQTAFLATPIGAAIAAIGGAFTVTAAVVVAAVAAIVATGTAIYVYWDEIKVAFNQGCAYIEKLVRDTGAYLEYVWSESLGVINGLIMGPDGFADIVSQGIVLAIDAITPLATTMDTVFGSDMAKSLDKAKADMTAFQGTLIATNKNSGDSYTVLKTKLQENEKAYNDQVAGIEAAAAAQSKNTAGTDSSSSATDKNTSSVNANAVAMKKLNDEIDRKLLKNIEMAKQSADKATGISEYDPTTGTSTKFDVSDKEKSAIKELATIELVIKAQQEKARQYGLTLEKQNMLAVWYGEEKLKIVENGAIKEVEWAAYVAQMQNDANAESLRARKAREEAYRAASIENAKATADALKQLEAIRDQESVALAETNRQRAILETQQVLADGQLTLDDERRRNFEALLDAQLTLDAKQQAEIRQIDAIVAAKGSKIEREKALLIQQDIYETARLNAKAQQEKKALDESVKRKEEEAKRKAEVQKKQDEQFKTNEQLLLEWEESTWEERIRMHQAGMSALSNLMNSQNAYAFELGKNAALVQTAMNTYSAAMGAYNSLAGIPYVGPALGAAAAAAAIYMGMQQMDKIRSQKRPTASRYADGGIVPGTSYTGDKVPAYLNSGEMVLNKAQQAQLFRVANGGSNNEDLVAAINGLGDRIQAMEIVVKTDDYEIGRSVNRAIRDGLTLEG